MTKADQKYEELKAAMNTQIDSSHETELCRYKKLREKNIKEREQAMEVSGPLLRRLRVARPLVSEAS